VHHRAAGRCLLNRLRFYQEAAEKAAMEYNVGALEKARSSCR
jgi:hypothetical protein